MWRDRQFWLALAAALPVWLALYFLLGRPAVDPAWPLREPRVFALPALFYPVLEEIIFRGGVQTWLARRLTRRWGPLSAANLGASVLFAVSHLIFHPPVWAASVFIPSLVFGYFKERHRHLGAPIALHVFYNAGYFWLFGV